MDSVARQIEDARTNLLDMTLRNKLLNFRELKRSTAKIVDEIPAEVYEQLVLEENVMRFLPAEEHPEHEPLEELPEDEAVAVDEDGTQHCRLCEDPDEAFSDRQGALDHLAEEHEATIEGEEIEGHSLEEIQNLWELPELAGPGPNRHTDTQLQTPHDESNLQKRLYNIANRAEALIEDAGYNALHLGVGFLDWTEAEAQEGSNRAPLILLPVELDREGARSSFKLRWNGEEVVGNLSLRHKLNEQGFELPEFDQPDEKTGIRDYLESVEEAAAEYDWSVRPEIHLGFFDFTKFVMYQDLDEENWEEGLSPADHPIVRALLDPDTSIDDPGGFDEERIDEQLDPEDVHHVKDADPSQIAAIEDVKRGRPLVIEGPPGTGKSQTIVNMIGELLAEDKTVLFVSEKLAALEVVKERLDEVRVGDFCLELHSDKASKSEFLQELERLAKLGSYHPDYSDETFERLKKRRDELNAYANALRTPYGELQRTPYDLFGLREDAHRHFADQSREVPRVRLEEPTSVTPEDHQSARSALETLDSRLGVVHPIRGHPWRGCRPGQVYPQDRHEIEDHLEDADQALQELQFAVQKLVEECEVRIPETIDQVEEAIEAARILRESDPVDAEVLENSAWNQAPPEAEELIEVLTRFRDLETDVGERTNPDHVDWTPQELLTEYQQLHATWTRWFRPRWYKVRGRLSTLYDQDRPDDSNQIIGDLEDLIELDKKRSQVQDAGDRGRSLFGSHWRGTSTDPGRLRRFADWIVRFRQKLLDEVLEEDSIELITRGVPDRTLDQTIQEAGERLTLVEVNLEILQESIGFDAERIFGEELDHVSLGALDDKVEQLQSNLDKLDRWGQFDAARQQVSDSIAAPLLDLVNDGALEPGDPLPCYRANLADGLLDQAFRDRDALGQFDGNVHEDRIEDFQDLDEETLQINRQRVLSTLVDRSPRLMQGASKSSEAGKLIHEFGKKRMHKPIRVLLEDAGELIQKMKPCFMMSPLSVAKYLDPGTLDFDVVIFDEASQVPPEDALGAIVRGSQLVVLGDSKQLPPTDFFNQVVDHRESEDEWAFSVQDVESILDLCRSAFPSKRLKWHYRSRHESLIAVSNQEFYENELVIYPSPVQEAEDLGLEFRHLPETTYDRGGSSVNREEAKAVAQAAAEHYQNNPHQSLGVGTFSTAQQEAVLEEVELLRKENPEIDKYFARGREEHFFAKNLERIQGDERDVIFISVGYGYDDNERFNHNFGPLNNRGGWRRLNVLITRARSRCVVFSNFTADAIDLSSTNARGVESLKVFLDYAENRNLSSLDVGGDPDSPFERAVKRFLEEEGYDVHAQVGAAGFRIDLAIPDPENPGRYVLGIECDGATYHSSPVARARDRQREAILEDRGWELHRIWSTDWYRNRNQTQERLVKAVDDAIESGALLLGDSTTNGSAPSEEEEEAQDEVNTPTLEDLQSDDFGDALDDLAQPYMPAQTVGYVWLGDHDVQSTLQAVTHIVEGEGPIHRELLQRRLRENSDVQRLGKNVKRTIRKAVNRAERRGEIETSGSFLYPSGSWSVEVRRREGDEAEIEWIPPEEIGEAAKRILEVQYATPKKDLRTQVARLFGFSRTGRKISNRIDKVLERMVAKGELESKGGRLDLPKQET